MNGGLKTGVYKNSESQSRASNTIITTFTASKYERLGESSIIYCYGLPNFKSFSTSEEL